MGHTAAMNTTSPLRALRMTLVAAVAAGAASALAQERPVYRCPGNLYTDQYSAKEAADLGCKTLDGAPVTVVQSPVRRPPVTRSRDWIASPISLTRANSDAVTRAPAS